MSDQLNRPTASGKDDYAEHLARVRPDADHSKALLQAQYKALHGEPPHSSSGAAAPEHYTEE